MSLKKGNTRPVNGFLEDWGLVLNPPEGQPNVVVQVEIDNASLAKIAGVGIGLVLLAKLVNKN